MLYLTLKHSLFQIVHFCWCICTNYNVWKQMRINNSLDIMYNDGVRWEYWKVMLMFETWSTCERIVQKWLCWAFWATVIWTMQKILCLLFIFCKLSIFFPSLMQEVYFMLPSLLSLLLDCAKKTDQTVVSISLGALVHLIEAGGHQFSESDWDTLLKSIRCVSYYLGLLADVRVFCDYIND